MAKIAVYSILKNEELFVERWINSAVDADYIVAVDTGSTDKTLDILAQQKQRLGDQLQIHSISIQPWRFDTARNASLALVPSDADLCIALDVDEILDTDWHEAIDRIWQPSYTRIRYPYVWSWSADGVPETEYLGDKIHTRKNYRWTNCVHEVLRPYMMEEVPLFTREFRILHFPDDTKPRTQYFSLLEASVKEDPHDDRNCYYLGREYYYHNRWQDCIRTLEHHLSMPSATWDLERSSSARMIAKSYYALGDNDKALNFYQKAIQESSSKEAWIDLAQHYYSQKEWEFCFITAKKACGLVKMSDVYLTEHKYYKGWAEDLVSVSAFYLGMLQISLDYAQKAVALSPTDPRLQDNLNLVSKAVSNH